MNSTERPNTVLQNWKKDFKPSQLVWCASIIAYFILFSNLTIQLFNNILVIPFISTCPQSNFWVNVVFTVLLLSSIYHLAKQIWENRLLPSVRSILLSISVIFIYLVFFRFNKVYTFFWLWNFKGFFYIDILVLSVLFFVSSYKSYLPALYKETSFLSLIDDSPNNLKDDFLNRSSYAKELAKHINATVCEISFAISVVGEWGAGKTDFMLRLKDCLSKNEDNKIIDFNPWRVSKSEAIIEEFFKTLSTELKPFNKSIASKIKDYSKRILQTGKEMHYKLIDTIIDELIPEKSIEEQYQAINKSIKATGKRFIIFIDDVDRLSGKEVMEILRLIRNAASFSNTFFVVGIDQNYIVKVLSNTRDFANENEYLKKVFQLTITLPVYRKKVFNQNLEKYLLDEKMDGVDRSKISQGIKNVIYRNGQFSQFDIAFFESSSFFETLLDNVRDLKRFCNSFRISYEILKDHIDVSDLILLELIKTKSTLAYDLLRNKKILKTASFETRNIYSLDVDKYKKYFTEENADTEYIQAAIDYMLDNQNQNQGPRMFRQVRNFYLYFSQEIIGRLPISEFENIILKDFDQMHKAFFSWISENKGEELYELLQRREYFDDKNKFKNVISALLLLPMSDGRWQSLVGQLCYHNWKNNQSAYFEDSTEKQRNFYLELVKSKKIPYWSRAFVLSIFLYNINMRNTLKDNFFIRKEDLLNAIFDLFKQYISEKPSSFKEMISLYKMNSISENVHLLNIDSRATKIFRQYLINEKIAFESFTKNLIQYANHSERHFLTFEESLEIIFEDPNEYKILLTEKEFDSFELNHLRTIILRYFDDFYLKTGKTHFRLDSRADSDFIHDLLQRNLSQN